MVVTTSTGDDSASTDSLIDAAKANSLSLRSKIACLLRYSPSFEAKIFLLVMSSHLTPLMFQLVYGKNFIPITHINIWDALIAKGLKSEKSRCKSKK